MSIGRLFKKEKLMDENYKRIHEDAAHQTYLQLLNEFRYMDLWLKIVPVDLTQIRKMFERADLEAFELAPLSTINYKTIPSLTSDTIRRRHHIILDTSSDELNEFSSLTTSLGPTCSILINNELGTDCVFQSVIEMRLDGFVTPDCYELPNTMNEITSDYVMLDGLNFKPLYQVKDPLAAIRLVTTLLTAVNKGLDSNNKGVFSLWWNFFNSVLIEYNKYVKFCGIVNKELLKNPYYRWESLFIIEDIWKYSSNNYEEYLNNITNSIVELDVTKEQAYELCLSKTRKFIETITMNRKAINMKLF